MIVSFLEGKAKQIYHLKIVKLVGIETAKMHEINKKFKIKRQNDLSINSWRKFETQ
jgi:Ser/Thr protein kinase RdoA (MazF antagonist)